MNTLEIIRNGLMQCIEKIEALLKRMQKAEATVEEQGNKIKDGMVSLSVIENFASSQFANFTYLYYEENGDIKSMLFNDGNVFKPKIYSYVISGKPLSYRCSGDTLKVEFKNFDTSSVTNMEYMFADCYSIKSLDLSNFNTSSVTDMGEMFSDCSGLTSLDLSNFNTSSVTDMGGMFSDCSGLTSLDLSNFNTSSVTDMGFMFYNCNRLKSLDVTNFNTSSVTRMDRMFSECLRITSLDVSNFDTSSVTDISDMFLRCNSLISIIGTHTLEEVQAGTVKAMRGLKVSISFSDSPNLERASILALFYGLADLTGKTKQTVVLHATAKARLTAEDIKIATDKNWDVQ